MAWACHSIYLLGIVPSPRIRIETLFAFLGDGQNAVLANNAWAFILRILKVIEKLQAHDLNFFAG